MDTQTDEGKRELLAWVTAQLQAQARHVVQKDLVTGKKARAYAAWALPGKLCIGRIVSVNNKAQAYWVISGDSPTDELELKLAATPRDAARHFALKWQMMAARLGDARQPAPSEKPGTWSEVSGKLAWTAEALHRLTTEDEHWTAPPPDTGTAGSEVRAD
ncbi:MAG: DUF4826 family protein [Xanthomonadaceae bacterium]|nr:DUF4826 family protein [Xanthomonadaceae bacterium]